MGKGLLVALAAGAAAWGLSRKLAEPAQAAQINTTAQLQTALGVLEAQVKESEALVQGDKLNLPGQVAVLEKPYLDIPVNYKDLDPVATPTETANIVRVADAVKVHNILEGAGLPAIGSSILAGTQSYAEAQGITYVEALERTTGIETTPELRQALADAGIITQEEVMAEPTEAPAQTGYGGFASPEEFEEHYGYSYFIDLAPGGTLIPVGALKEPELMPQPEPFEPEPLPAIPVVVNELEPAPVPYYNPYIPVLHQATIDSGNLLDFTLYGGGGGEVNAAGQTVEEEAAMWSAFVT